MKRIEDISTEALLRAFTNPVSFSPDEEVEGPPVRIENVDGERLLDAFTNPTSFSVRSSYE